MPTVSRRELGNGDVVELHESHHGDGDPFSPRWTLVVVDSSGGLSAAADLSGAELAELWRALGRAVVLDRFLRGEELPPASLRAVDGRHREP